MVVLDDALQQHDLIGLDASIFIYQIEQSPRYAPLTTIAFALMEQGTVHGVTALLTLLEITVLPLRRGRVEVAEEYERRLGAFPNLRLIELDRPVIRRAADLRARFGWRPPDALQVGACLVAGATAFLTNDRRLRRVPELQIIVLEDYLDESHAPTS